MTKRPSSTAIGYGVKRANKFGAKKTRIDGIVFDSKAEAMHYLVLKDRQRKGEISDLSLQPKFYLVVNGLKVGTYTPDFMYQEGGQWVAVDVKGFKARDFALRSKLFMALHPHIQLRVNGLPAKKPTYLKEKAA